ncbi:3-beta-hydroxysteroid-Delta(8),Delta(7)-isomerase [Eremomyces bilateralis CBS 781.70]|uniref:3-beta-hydroxysteroid-Delta(8), Delta(7)-isomerase n=1 Tax=Eremomyces bilateralis CBS 781.70 TaxID=1392243 RepID=A0A6G1FUU9_9PEZI|nr:3-beta-hydroxysteroid-Delta(8),Delta(7)-isomerase [Eremomyces bilateralis CBS 781.70]KAF1809533.1 3-beta-hydroxysteroid-Delta(8),Delta(7)-isomerase [Eremomyces bilateralis CBS 781.70]
MTGQNYYGSSAPPAPKHPYYPPDITLRGYIPNSYDVPTLLQLFSLACGSVLLTAIVLAKCSIKSLRTGQLAAIMWFTLCGCIHLFFEGYFAYNFRRMPAMMDLFGQLWKEYAQSDSRYLTSDPFVLCMESITAAFWGPLSFLLTYYIATDHPLRHPFQIIVSLGQLYGDVLYYSTSMFDHYMKGLMYSRPEPYYFYGYYVMMNAPWIVIPLYLIYQSMGVSYKAFGALKNTETVTIKIQANRKAVESKKEL